jgi:hypothetical protein
MLDSPLLSVFKQLFISKIVLFHEVKALIHRDLIFVFPNEDMESEIQCTFLVSEYHCAKEDHRLVSHTACQLTQLFPKSSLFIP